MAVEGAVLLLTVYDYDMITANDFTGMSVVALNDVPGHSSYKGPSSPELLNLTLPVFVLKEEDKIRSLLELINRAQKGDARALNFFKINKMLNLKKLIKEGSKSSLFS